MGRCIGTGEHGFTLLELMFIVTIVGILVTMAVPSYQTSVVKAREARSTSTWQEIYEASEGGVFDLHSGSDLVGTNGVPYNQW